MIRDYKKVESMRDLVATRPRLKRASTKVLSIRISGDLFQEAERKIRKLRRGESHNWSALCEALIYRWLGEPTELLAEREKADNE